MRIVAIGEVLWDVFEDSEKLGGAPFNFAVNAMRLGHDVDFVSAVGDDARGRAVLTHASSICGPASSRSFLERRPEPGWGHGRLAVGRRSQVVDGRLPQPQVRLLDCPLTK